MAKSSYTRPCELEAEYKNILSFIRDYNYLLIQFYNYNTSAEYSFSMNLFI